MKKLLLIKYSNLLENRKIRQYLLFRINFLKVSERKEVIRVRRNKMFGFGFFLVGIAGMLVYIAGVKRFNLFKN